LIETLLRDDPLLAAGTVVIGPKAWVGRLAGETGVRVEPVGRADFQAVPGHPGIEGAAIALRAMEIAAVGCREGRFRGVVTAPVSKHWLQQAGFRFPGQTEFFADQWQGDPTMAFVGERLRVVLATWHIPLREVSAALTGDCLEKAVRRAAELGRRLGCDRPRIGVCGLNPHAGEGGILGDEELIVLDPRLDLLREEFPGLSRCLPGDTVFHRQAAGGDFDVVVAAYHDQGLAAVKTLEFESAVNVTLGLPFVRTSPDHGTAFDIAGKGIAHPGSFEAALRVLHELTA
jgi:4-hydroxythreonine-4-phosphate dehydrogenase